VFALLHSLSPSIRWITFLRSQVRTKGNMATRLSTFGYVLAWLALGISSPCLAQKSKLAASIEQRGMESWTAAKQIWEWAEPGYQEHKSSKLLADLLERHGFQVERGVAEIPTAFTATFGSGAPVIGILGEYDALPGLSQQAVPTREPRQSGGYGHGCGHHLFGVASASAAIAIAEQLRAGEIRGTVRFYGCPAEEGGVPRSSWCSPALQRLRYSIALASR